MIDAAQTAAEPAGTNARTAGSPAGLQHFISEHGSVLLQQMRSQHPPTPSGVQHHARDKSRDRITGPSIVKLMRSYGKTIRGLSMSMGITQRRVRHVRACGVAGVAYTRDWMQAITGSCFDSASSCPQETCDCCPTRQQRRKPARHIG